MDNKDKAELLQRLRGMTVENAGASYKSEKTNINVQNNEKLQDEDIDPDFAKLSPEEQQSIIEYQKIFDEVVSNAKKNDGANAMPKVDNQENK